MLQVTSVRLPSDGGRAKGFGYAEFEDRQSLLEALTFSEAVSLFLYHYIVLTVVLHVITRLQIDNKITCDVHLAEI